MDFITFIYVYLSFTAFIIFVLLFGDAPWAQGTPLSFTRWLISEAWVDALEFVVTRACGAAGLKTLDVLTVACCERRSPVLQISYLLIWSVCYWLYWEHVFKLLPNLYAGAYHLYTGTGAVCLTLTSFLLASSSSPGRVTQQNAARYLAAYPPDGLLFPPKSCVTCQLWRPGRSKHCGVCGGCIPRFDHHCGWVNACVGLHNTRTFLMFLAANLATCCYALLLLVATMRGELHKRGLFDVYVYDTVTRQRAPLHTQPSRFLELLVVRYPVQVALALFCAVGALLMFAFLAYQVYLISVGTTTYEQFKRNALQRDMQEVADRQAAAVAAAQQSTQAAVHGSSAGSSDRQQCHSGDTPHQQQRQQQQQQQRRSKMWPWRRRVRAPHVPKPPAAYHRGFRQNWFEVLWPEQFLQQQQQRQQQQQQRQQQQQHWQQQQEGGFGQGGLQQQDGTVTAAAGQLKPKQQ